MHSTADDLYLDWCSYQAAKHACEQWHYSGGLPASKRVHIGVWERGVFVGAIVASRGASRNIGRPFLLEQSEVAEVTRVALHPQHKTPVSRILAIAVRMLKRQSPGLKLLISYADPRHGHHGGVYQAANWWFIGQTNRECLLRVGGRVQHPRTVGSRYGHRGIAWVRAHVDPRAERIVTEPKFKYLFPFDADLRAQLLPLVRPYPTRPKEQDPARSPAGLARATRSRPLHSDEGAHV